MSENPNEAAEPAEGAEVSGIPDPTVSPESADPNAPAPGSHEYQDVAPGVQGRSMTDEERDERGEAEGTDETEATEESSESES